MIICYTVPEIQHVTHVIFIFHFGLIFALLPPLTTQKIKILKKIILQMCTKNYDHDVQLLRYGAQQTDGRTERWTYGKSDI